MFSSREDSRDRNANVSRKTVKVDFLLTRYLKVELGEVFKASLCYV